MLKEDQGSVYNSRLVYCRLIPKGGPLPNRHKNENTERCTHNDLQAQYSRLSLSSPTK